MTKFAAVPRRSSSILSTGSLGSFSEIDSSPSSTFRQTLSREFTTALSVGRPYSDTSNESFRSLSKLNLDGLKIYGREAEIQRLTEAYESILQVPEDSHVESSRMVLISGYSGTGKSLLAAQLKNIVSRTRGFFATGKFDLQQSIEPYTAFADAFTELAEYILARPESSQLVKKIREAVGTEGGVLNKAMPGLETLLGDQQEETDSGPIESRNRLQFLFRKFTRAVCAANPLVLVLDDLHWADMASLELLESLANDPHISSFLIVGTCRDNSVYPEHPFVLRLGDIEASGTNVDKITLGNLDALSVNTLVATALRSSEDMTESLAELITRKTRGNAFFVILFLKTLHEEEMLTFDMSKLQWHWDKDKIQAMEVTENVVDLVMGRIQKLPSETQLVLQVAACLGQNFALDILKIVMDRLKGTAILSDLFSGTLFPDVDDEVDRCVKEGMVDYGRQETEGTTYSFIHDQIQSAALSLIPEDTLPAFQLHLGQSLLRDEDSGDFDKHMFVALDMCNRGSSDMKEEDPQRVQLARSNLRAGEKAMESAAFVQAAKYFKSGLALLGTSLWKQDYQLTLDLFCVCAEAEYCTGNFDEMQKQVDQVLQNARSFDEKIPGYMTLIQALCARDELHEGIDTAIHVLKEMGLVSLPRRPAKITLLIDLLQTKLLLRNHTQESLSSIPVMQDQKRIQGMKILERLCTLAYFAEPELFLMSVLQLVRWSVKYGVCKHSPGAFGCYGLILCGKLGDVEGGFMFGEVALKTVERLNARAATARTVMLVYMMIHHHFKDARLGLKPFLYGHQVGMETGDVQNAMFNFQFHDEVDFLTGQRLDIVERETSYHCALMKEYNQILILSFSLARWQSILNLQGKSSDSLVLTGKAMDQEEMLKMARNSDNRVLVIIIDSFRMLLAYIFGDYMLANELAESINDIEDNLVAHFTTTRIVFYACLTALALGGPRTKLGRKQRRRGAAFTKKIKGWAKSGNVNCVHMVQFAEAEMAALKGDYRLALESYGACIVSASRNGCRQDRALAHERAGLFCLGMNDLESAAYHIEAAVQAYSEWGAMAKVNQLIEKHGNLLSKGSHEVSRS